MAGEGRAGRKEDRERGQGETERLRKRGGGDRVGGLDAGRRDGVRGERQSGTGKQRGEHRGKERGLATQDLSTEAGRGPLPAGRRAGEPLTREASLPRRRCPWVACMVLTASSARGRVLVALLEDTGPAAAVRLCAGTRCPGVFPATDTVGVAAPASQAESHCHPGLPGVWGSEPALATHKNRKSHRCEV